MQEMKPYMTIQEACKYTGLSQHYLRQGCRDNTVPHIMVGAKYMVCIPALLARLETEALKNTEGR